MILLPCPVRPDLDCIAGSVGYAEYLLKAKNKIAKAWLCGVPDGEAQFYLDKFPEITFANENEIADVKNYIFVDFSATDFSPNAIPHDKVIEVIDHRFFNKPDQDFPNARVQLDAIGAAATQITEYFIKDDITPSFAVASMLYGAIYTHTLCCNGTLFTERDKLALSWLEKLVPDAKNLVQEQLQARKAEIIAEFPDVLTTEMKIETGANGQFGISQLEMIEGEKFWEEHKTTIDKHFSRYDYPTCLNIIDLTSNKSVFYSSTKNPIDLLKENVTICQEEPKVIHFIPALMRKQIIPIIREL